VRKALGPGGPARSSRSVLVPRADCGPPSAARVPHQGRGGLRAPYPRSSPNASARRERRERPGSWFQIQRPPPSIRLKVMKPGNVALIVIGLLLIAGVWIGSTIQTQNLTNQLNSCNSAAQQQYQTWQNSNPYTPGSEQWEEYNDQITADYQEELAVCQSNYNNNSQSNTGEIGVWSIMGLVLLVIGLYRWHGERPKEPTTQPNPEAVSSQNPPSPPYAPPPPSASPTERYCPSCGMGSARTATFCGGCGKPLPPPP
jgi:type II secretory pathway pseudopilin PulG